MTSKALPPMMPPTAKVSAPRRTAPRVITSSGSEVEAAVKMPPMAVWGRPVRAEISAPDSAIAQPATPTTSARPANAAARGTSGRLRLASSGSSVRVAVVRRGSHMGISLVRLSSTMPAT